MKGGFTIWYTPNAQRRYNRIFNFTVGTRGGGKTFNTLLDGVKRFKDKGEQFIYLRRSQTDLDDACRGREDSGDLFADIRHHGYYEEHELKVAGSKSGNYNFYLDGELMGYGYALSTQRRSASRPKVTTIIFDEFLVDTDNPYQRYLPNEFTQFNHLYETVARGRDITVFFIGNAFSMVNPYFLGMGIRIPEIQENKIYSGKFWTFVEWRDEGFIEMRKQTQHYQATAGTDFSTHAFDNKYFLDNDEFLKRRSKDSEHHFSISYLNKLYGVWVDWDEGRYYVTTKGAKTSKEKTVSMSLADNSPNNVNIRKYRNMPFMKAFRHAVDTNEVYFDTQETYNNLQEVVYLLRTVT